MNPQVARIRQLFLSPKPTYLIAEAAALFDVGWREVRGWIESGELAGVETEQGLLLAWEELASFAMEWWSQEVVEKALGAGVAAAIPELLRLAPLAVRIPRMEIAALERLAQREGVTVSTLLARELRDLVSADAEWLSGEIPGFAEALAWPGEPLSSR
jgi:hypothetical protein